MNHPEMRSTRFSKCHTQSHKNEVPNKPSSENDSFTTCMQCSSNKTRSHNRSLDKANREEMAKDKSTDSTEPIQHDHPVSFEEDHRHKLTNYRQN